MPLLHIVLLLYSVVYCKFLKSVNIVSFFYVVPDSRILHIKKATDRPTVAAPKCQPSEDEPPDY